MKRTAGVYLLRGRFILVAHGVTTDGLTLDQSPVISMDECCPSGWIGVAVTWVLSAWRTGIDQPLRNEYAKTPHPVVAAIGARGYNMLKADSTYMTVEEEQNTMAFVHVDAAGRAMRTEIGSGEAEKPTVDAIGEAVRRAFDLAQGP